MKKKKSIIIYAVVAALIVLGFVLSMTIDWPVDTSNASGDIAKSSHFSRKTAEEASNNMQELLQNDENYKKDIVAAYLIMKTRAEQFNALVDMSAEVAANVKELEPVVKEMKEALPMIKNVCESMEKAGKDLNTALGGEKVGELEQNTSNAAVAYNTLQKQNKLADKFIEVADQYIGKSGANDRLKFVRDQWVDYQRMTAALTEDKKLAEELSKKGYQLAEDKRIKALGSFGEGAQMANLQGAAVARLACVDNSLANTLNNLDLNAGIASSAVLRGIAEKSLGAEAVSQLKAVDKALNAEAVNKLGAEAVNKLGAEAGNKLGAEAVNKLGAEAGNKLNAEAVNKLGAEAGNKLNAEAVNKLGAEAGNKLNAVTENSLGLDAANKLGIQPGSAMQLLGSTTLGGLVNLQGQMGGSMVRLQDKNLLGCRMMKVIDAVADHGLGIVSGAGKVND